MKIFIDWNMEASTTLQPSPYEERAFGVFQARWEILKNPVR
jgi:hypothetical protein